MQEKLFSHFFENLTYDLPASLVAPIGLFKSQSDKIYVPIEW